MNLLTRLHLLAFISFSFLNKYHRHRRPLCVSHYIINNCAMNFNQTVITQKVGRATAEITNERMQSESSRHKQTLATIVDRHVVYELYP